MELVDGFLGEDRKRVVGHLQRLLPYLAQDKFVIVGGLAIRYHLVSCGIEYPHRPLNDLDIIVKDRDVVSTAVAREFLVYHYHPNNYYLVLVDPISRTKVDIFKYVPSPNRNVKVAFGSHEVNVVSIEDQLVKTVLDIQRISEELKVDPKQFLDTKLLMQIADMKLADKYWQANKFERWPGTIKEAIQRAEKVAREHPEWLQEKPFRKPKPYFCKNCQSADGFEIAPMEEVYKVLRYME